MAEKYEILRATNYNIRAQISAFLRSLDTRLKEVEAGGGGITGQYLWSTLTTGDPTAGHIATNNADYASVTEIRVHKLSNQGNDLTVVIQPLKQGSLLGIFEINEPAATALYQTTAIPVLTGDYFVIPVVAEPFAGQSLPTVQDSALNVTFTASTDVGNYMIYTYTDVDYTVQYHNECVLVDSSAGAVTITLPASPEKDDYAGVWDAGNSAALNNITILRNGNTINSLAEDAVIDMNGGRFDLCYDDANTWKLAHVLGCIPYASTPINPQQSRALGWWECDEPETGASQTLIDQAAAYEINSSNPYVSVAGVRNQASQLINGGWLESNLLPDQFTLVDQIWGFTFWYRTPSIIVPDTYIASSWRDANVPDAINGRRKWRFINNLAGNGFTYSIGYGDGGQYVGNAEVHTGDISLTPDTWYHNALTHDPDNDQMSLTVSKRGETIGTRLVETVVGGAWVGTGPTLNLPIFFGRDTVGAKGSDGVIEMPAFWDTSAILSEADVQALFENEPTYSELSI